MDTAGLMMDPGITIAVQNISPALTFLAGQGEFLDSTPWYLLLISVLCLGLHPRHGVRLAVLFGITSGLNEALKLALHLPRPYWISPAVKVFANHSSFGFPSGAAMFGAAMYGYIATVVRRWWAVTLCVLLLVTTSLVRLFAGVHFLTDIFGGLFFGFLLLLLFVAAGPGIEKYAKRLSRPGRCILIIIIAALPLLLVVPAYLSLAGWELPAAWVEIARQQTGVEINPVSIRYAWGSTGIILGSLAGYEVLLSRGGWVPPENPLRRGAVVLAGTGSVLLVYAITSAARSVPDLPAPLDQISRIMVMALVLFWLTCCVPLIARRAGYSAEECLPVTGEA